MPLMNDAKEAFQQVYADTFPKARRYILYNSGTSDDANDIFQESLAAAWINLSNGRFTGDLGDFKHYVMAIVRHKWLNRMNSAQYKKTMYKVPPEQLYEPVDEHDLKEQVEESDRLMACLQDMGTPCKEILHSFYYHKKSMQEIGEKLKYSADSIKTIKYRCMQRLRKLYLNKINSLGTR